MEQEKKRVRRSKEEIVKEKVKQLEEKRALYLKKATEMDEQINELLNPPSTVKMKDIKDRINELGLPLEDVMKAVEKLGKK